MIIAASASLPRQHRPVKSTFSFRPLSKKGTDSFKEMLLGTDWNAIKLPTSSQSTVAYTAVVQSYIDACFPLKIRKTKSTDVPWFNERTRRSVAKKNRIYKKEGKSVRYVEAKKKSDDVLREEKNGFL